MSKSCPKCLKKKPEYLKKTKTSQKCLKCIQIFQNNMLKIILPPQNISSSDFCPSLTGRVN